MAHLGASQVAEINIRTGRVVRTIGGLSQVHGVLVVLALRRVYARRPAPTGWSGSTKGTGQIMGESPTGAYPDGLAYDPANGTIWATNESGGSETVIDAATGTRRGTVRFGWVVVGNVASDPVSGDMLVDVRGRNELAVVDPATRSVIRRVALPGCDDDHGLAVDSTARLAFVACDVNDVLLTVDLTTGRVTGTADVGVQPDVVTFDSTACRAYVASESGQVTVFHRDGLEVQVIAPTYLGDDAHSVAVDPATGRSYFPMLNCPGGHPAVLMCAVG